MAYSDFNDLPSVLNQFELELIQETIDPTIYLFPSVDKILGILMAMVTSTNDEA